MYMTEKSHDPFWHLNQIPRTQIKITVCCQCNTKKVSEIARTTKSEISEVR